MDGKASRVPVLWDDRCEVAKAFDVGIFSDFCNLEGVQFRQSGHPVLEDVLSEGDRRFLYERVLLTVRPTQVQRRVGTGGHVRLAPAVVTKGKPFFPLPRETALASCRRQGRRDPPGPVAVRTEGNKFCQKQTLVLRCGPGAYKL